MAGKITKFLIIILMVKLAAAQHDSNVRTGFFNLPVDHFSTTDRRTWDIRYFINEQHYREDGAIFIYVNDGTARDQLIQEGNMFEVADEEGAVLISLEQRYFGQSFPTPDASFENLQWLTVHQSVADVARFAGFMRQRYNNAPVIIWGRGRGASIAVWARQKYPNVIDGAWGSSALLNAIVEDVDFLPNVFNTITQVGGADCGQVIADAFRMIEDAFEAGNTSYVETRLNTCDAIDVGNGYDLARLTYNIAFDLGFGFLKDVRYPEIDEKCFIMRGLDTPDNPPSDPLDAFARWYIDDFHFNRGIQCLPASNQQAVTDYQDPSWTGLATTSTRRQRLWLTCSQFGQFQVANHGQGHPFGTRFDLRFFERWCADAFENDIFLDPWFMSDAVLAVNRIFGGLNPGAFRTFITHGELDPFRSLGPSQDINNLSPVVVIPLISYGRDVASPDASVDYVVLHQTKLRIQQTIREWIEYARFGEPAPPPPPSPPAFSTRWFNLPVDHFSTTDRRTFDVRYLVNENHYRENGPIFIYIEGYSVVSPTFITSGNVFDAAIAQGGVLIALECRFFGMSLPTPDASFENLQWLTVHQVVADIGRFANFMKRQYHEAPIILYGRNYGGKLAVWARQKYPNVIDGAYASSSGINVILENVDYFPNVYRTITQIGGPECGQVITDAFIMIEEAFETGNTSYVEERLRICDPIDVGNGYDLAMMTYFIALEIGHIFLSNAIYPQIEEKCNIMRGLDTPGNPPSDPLDAFARWYIDDFHFNRGTQCVQVRYDKLVLPEHDSNWNATAAHRQRQWLYCSQLGQNRVANHGQGHPFGSRFDMRFLRQFCADTFQNDIFTEPWFMEDAIQGVNRMFGGLNPATVRTFMTHGEMDPIRTLGPSSDLNELSPVVVMSLQSHSRDMGSIDEADYIVLRQTKLRVQAAINEWIEYARYGEIPPLPTT